MSESLQPDRRAALFTPRRIARIAILVALSVVGSFIKIPSPTGTVALDAAPAYLAGLAFSPVEGAIIGVVGHLVTAFTSGFPLGVPVHLLVAALMAICVLVFGVVARKTDNVWVAGALAILINGVLGAAMMIPIGGLGMFLAFLLPLTVGSAINVVVAGLAATALSAAGLADYPPSAIRQRRRGATPNDGE